MGFRVLPYLLVGGAALCLASGALATDGVIEINQAKVIASGGFPFQISQSGSYRLTSDLDVTVVGLPDSANTDAIQIVGAASTTIDLNGFRILGPANCDSFPCANAGTGAGVRSQVGSNRLITIRNGSVLRMGGKGLLVTSGDVRISDVSLLENGAGGIDMTAGVISRAIVRRNGGHAISVYNAVIESSVASDNSGNEILATFATIQSCALDPNGGIAIQLFNGTIQNTHVKTNANIAVTCTEACALGGNKFTECNGAGCLGGAGVLLQVPPASNMCGGEVCPDPAP